MEDTTTLYFRQGPSDKVYQAWIRPKDNGFMVHFAYCRRGSTLNTGSKTSAPVEYQIAKDIYKKLVREKMSKGYLPGADSPQQAPVEGPKKHSGIQCQLLNPIEEKAKPSLASTVWGSSLRFLKWSQVVTPSIKGNSSSTVKP